MFWSTRRNTQSISTRRPHACAQRVAHIPCAGPECWQGRQRARQKAQSEAPRPTSPLASREPTSEGTPEGAEAEQHVPTPTRLTWAQALQVVDFKYAESSGTDRRRRRRRPTDECVSALPSGLTFTVTPAGPLLLELVEALLCRSPTTRPTMSAAESRTHNSVARRTRVLRRFLPSDEAGALEPSCSIATACTTGDDMNVGRGELANRKSRLKKGCS